MFKQSVFHETVKSNGGVIVKFAKGSNVAKFVVKSKEESSEKTKLKGISSDTISEFKFYVRVIMNMLVFDHNDIAEMIESSKEGLKEFVDTNMTKGSNIDIDSLISTSGVKVKGKNGMVDIVNWVSVDVPYIEDKIEEVNICINSVIADYLTICEDKGIEGEDKFAYARFVCKTKMIANESAYAGTLFANYQKPNSNMANSAIRIFVPKDVEYKNKDNGFIEGCSLNFCDSGKEIEVESVFKDKFRIFEFNVETVVEKAEGVQFSHFSSRSILVFKKDKREHLIKNLGTAIEVSKFSISVKEHSKITGMIGNYITKFLSLNTRMSKKAYTNISYLISVIFTNKVFGKVLKKDNTK